MNEIQVKICPHCKSTNIGIGYQLGGGRLFTDRYAYHSAARCSEIETYFCKSCGSVLLQKVKRPDILKMREKPPEKSFWNILKKTAFF